MTPTIKDVLFIFTAVIFIPIYLCVMICIIIPNLPDNALRYIERDLQRKGYDIHGVEFEQVGGGLAVRIYKSSEPIYIGEDYVSFWIVTAGHSTLFSERFTIKPLNSPTHIY